MSNIPQSLRERLLGQKQALARGGITIDNKTFTKDRLRLLPILDRESIGLAYTSIYLPSIKKSSTSPATYGLVCPITKAIDEIKNTGSKEDLEYARNFANVSTEYWCGVISRRDMGPAENPKIRILRAKQTVFNQLLGWLTDEDMGEDITSVKDGRDFMLKKTGVMKETTWTCEKFDREPLSEDPDYIAEVLRLSALFDVSKHFYALDLDVIKKAYEGLTGEALPASLEDPIQDFVDSKKSRTAPAESAPTKKPTFTKPAPRPAAKQAPVETPADDEQPADNAGDDDAGGASLETAADGPEQDANFPIGTRVLWTEGESQIKGMVVGMDLDPSYAGCILVRQDGEPEESAPWSLPAADLSIEEVKPVVSRRRPPAKSAAEIEAEATKAEQPKPAGKITKPASASIREKLAKK